MKLGHKLILTVIDIAKESNLSVTESDKLLKLIEPFLKSPEDLDLMTICKLEILLNQKLLIIPTKQEWRKIKLKKLNEICLNGLEKK